MDTLGKTKKLVVVTALITLLFALLFGGVFYYFIFLQKSLTEMNRQIAVANRDYQTLLQAEQSLKTLTDNKISIEGLIITNESEVPFIKDLEMLATTTRVEYSVSAFQHEVISSVSRFEKVSIQATVKGPLNNVFNFLQLLQRYPKGVELKQVQLEVLSGDPKQKNVWRLTFILKALKVK